MTSRIPSLCRACKRARRSGLQCEAFPNGIPQDMLTAGGDHHEPREGDHGLQFEQAPTREAREALSVWQQTFGTA